MIFCIPSGKHRALPLRFALYWRKHLFAWKVMFDESCRYDLGTADQGDINKLIGIGYLPGHHKHSARFGWRYIPDIKLIELSAYCYIKGRREIRYISYVEIGKEYKIELHITRRSYLFSVDNANNKNLGLVEVAHEHGKKLGYRLGVFFGGNQSAPREMKIQIEKG